MQNYTYTIKQEIDKILINTYKTIDKNIIEKVIVEPIKDKTLGELSTNAAFIVGKFLKTNPKNLANELSKKLNTINGVEIVNIAGSGFLNFIMDKNFWLEELKNVLANHH